MKHTGVMCLKCETAMFSRARHDTRRCECGAVEIDGGWDLMRLSTLDKNSILFLNVNLPKDVTKQTAWDAWNTRDDSYLYFRATDKWPKWLIQRYNRAVRRILSSHA